MHLDRDPALEATMRAARAALTMAAVAAATGLVLLPGGRAQACNQRGEFCSYPAWAANAFADPRDRVNPATSTTMNPRPAKVASRKRGK